MLGVSCSYKPSLVFFMFFYHTLIPHECPCYKCTFTRTYIPISISRYYLQSKRTKIARFFRIVFHVCTPFPFHFFFIWTCFESALYPLFQFHIVIWHVLILYIHIFPHVLPCIFGVFSSSFCLDCFGCVALEMIYFFIGMDNWILGWIGLGRDG